MSTTMTAAEKAILGMLGDPELVEALTRYERLKAVVTILGGVGQPYRDLVGFDAACLQNAAKSQVRRLVLKALDAAIEARGTGR